MKTILILFITSIYSTCLIGQINYSTPPENVIPEKLQNLPRIIEVQQFPKINDPIKIKDTYYWKHATSVLCKTDEITLIEYGAYLYYNNQWNLRRSYPLKELKKTFGITNEKMLQGHPYTWANNWRTDQRLFGGWALWYFIGRTSDGKTVCGYETIHTTDNLLNK